MNEIIKMMPRRGTFKNDVNRLSVEDFIRRNFPDKKNYDDEKICKFNWNFFPAHKLDRIENFLPFGLIGHGHDQGVWRGNFDSNLRQEATLAEI